MRSLINLGLTKGFVGRDKCGLMPIRGHSGVQGGAEMGAYATALPGGLPITAESAAKFSELWGFDVPVEPGLTAAEMIDAGHDGTLDVLVSSGGNFLEVLPDPAYCQDALARIRLRVHIDICLSSQMLVDPSTPTRWCWCCRRRRGTRWRAASPRPRPNAASSSARRCAALGSPRRGRNSGSSANWPRGPDRRWPTRSASPARRRSGRRSPQPSRCYAGIDNLAKFGDAFQYGGPHLCADWEFPTPDGRAHFSVVAACPTSPARTAPSWSPPGAASSSTAWCTNAVTPSPARPARPS